MLIKPPALARWRKNWTRSETWKSHAAEPHGRRKKTLRTRPLMLQQTNIRAHVHVRQSIRLHPRRGYCVKLLRQIPRRRHNPLSLVVALQCTCPIYRSKHRLRRSKWDCTHHWTWSERRRGFGVLIPVNTRYEIVYSYIFLVNEIVVVQHKKISAPSGGFLHA